MSKRKGDQTPVIGGCDIPAAVLDAPKPFGCAPDDDIGQQIFWLLSLHPDINLQFRDWDLAEMDDATKQTLLTDTQSVLGIHPLKSDVL